MRTITTTIETDLVEMIDQIASAYSMSRSAFVRMVLKKELARRGLVEMGLPTPRQGETKQNPKGENRKESDV